MRQLAELAAALALEFRGDGDCEIVGLASLVSADPQQLSFVANKKYLPQLVACAAGALILHPDWLDTWTGNCLISAHPYLSFAQATWLFDDRPQPRGSVHPSAVVAPDAQLASGVTIDAYAVVETGAVIGANAWIGAHCFVGAHVQVGADTTLRPGVVVYHAVEIGDHCLIHSNSVIGADGFGFAPLTQGWQKILQLATVRIGHRVEIGASTTIDRGALEDTVIGDGVIIDNQVHIAHGVHIGENTAIAGAVAIAGSTVVGKRCTIAGQAGLADHIEIADDVHIGGQGRVSSSVKSPGYYASGSNLQPLKAWSRSAVRFEQLDTMSKRIAQLEKQLVSLAAANDNKGS